MIVNMTGCVNTYKRSHIRVLSAGTQVQRGSGGGGGGGAPGGLKTVIENSKCNACKMLLSYNFSAFFF